MEWINILVTIVSIVLGALGGGFGTWIFTLYKEKRNLDIATNEQALKIYQDLITRIEQERVNDVKFYKDALIEVNKKLFELEENKSTLEKEKLSLREENLRLKIISDRCPILRGHPCPITECERK